MNVNCVANLEISDNSQAEFVKFLIAQKTGFFAEWTSSGKKFKLPKNCVFRIYEVVPAPEDDDNKIVKRALDTMMADIIVKLKEFNANRPSEIVLEKILCTPAKPWAAIESEPIPNESFGGWGSEEKQKAYKRFAGAYLAKKPGTGEDEIKELFKLAGN